ncbi:hypothetical protein A3C67_03000 [Candidatus Nomurabacteria bacterium RIFCSPHIGHO2_02_FULL_42_19]|uniref:Uncharacterized protein n=1 Tax=Candidatus Nomurabacteria bacterium RIFCSPHIGHO2_02_FULL_42_19 TaxID=1801756 RepID=A0A1F6W1D6_9BACT|nr:MAG: hypothetical protein A3C67_03000 [Candidatus Nomurabacteria bacterium RIFCSPHIGHO2_02_FULL_42_19]
MINLIPNEEKKKKVKDFYYRLLVTAFAVFGFSILIAGVAMLPAYFLSSVRKNLINSKLETEKNQSIPSPDKETLTVVEDLSKKLDLIEKSRNSRYLVSQKVINEIMSEKMPDIKITQIQYRNESIKGKTISISGVASSRDRLLLFKRELENNIAFKKVDLPISNFVKGSNIKFSLGLTPS